ncbi:MAG: fibronectin type III domain-containing protein [Candidatus Omnitrophica bacterium]|nr:fibronectin type III domain-containing protein [Candidatus Omnitrophota bacterium]
MTAGYSSLVHAQVTNGATTVMHETTVTGGGAVGSGNPTCARTSIGEPIGGIAVNGSYTIQGNFPAAERDATPPTGTVAINGGAASTNAASVTLTLSATDNAGPVAQMQCSNDNVTYSAPEAYAPTKAWIVAAGDGPKTVYVKFKDAAGNWSPATTATIALDTAPPVLSTLSVSDVTATSASMTWTTNEPAISQAEYGMTSSHGMATPLTTSWVTSHTARLTGLSPDTLYHYCAYSRDGAGNAVESPDSMFTTAPPDTAPPSGSVAINAGAAVTNHPAVTLTLSATDNSGTVAQMQCSNDNVTYSVPEAYAPTKSWTLSSGDGSKTVYAKFSDPIGNWSSPASATITLDTTPPALAITSPSDGTTLGPQP